MTSERHEGLVSHHVPFPLICHGDRVSSCFSRTRELCDSSQSRPRHFLTALEGLMLLIFTSSSSLFLHQAAHSCWTGAGGKCKLVDGAGPQKPRYTRKREYGFLWTQTSSRQDGWDENEWLWGKQRVELSNFFFIFVSLHPFVNIAFAPAWERQLSWVWRVGISTG